MAGCGRFHIGDTASPGQPDLDTAVRQVLQETSRPAYVTRDREGIRLWKLTRAFYGRREFAPAWIERGSPRPQMNALIRAVHAADREGLDPELYSASLLDQRMEEASKGFLTSKGFNPREAVAMDVWLTWLYVKFASDLADGVSDLAHVDPSWKIQPETFDPLARLEAALRDNRVAESLFESDARPTRTTAALQKALADYRRKADRGDWPAVPSNLKLKAGESSPQVASRSPGGLPHPAITQAACRPGSMPLTHLTCRRRSSASSGATGSQTMVRPVRRSQRN